MIADVDFEPDAGEAQIGADQRVGKMERREVELLGGQVLGPRLIERDDERRRGVELADGVDRLGGDLQAGLFAEAQGVAVRHAGGDLPEVDSAAIALDDGADVVEHEREQAVEVAFPEIGPIGHAAIVELQQRAGADAQAGGVGPFDLGVGVGPVAAAFDGFDRPPGERQRHHVECVDDVPGDVGLGRLAAQVDAEPRGELAAAGARRSAIAWRTYSSVSRAMVSTVVASDRSAQSAAVAASSCVVAARENSDGGFEHAVARGLW